MVFHVASAKDVPGVNITSHLPDNCHGTSNVLDQCMNQIPGCAGTDIFTPQPSRNHGRVFNHGFRGFSTIVLVGLSDVGHSHRQSIDGFDGQERRDQLPSAIELLFLVHWLHIKRGFETFKTAMKLAIFANRQIALKLPRKNKFFQVGRNEKRLVVCTPSRLCLHQILLKLRPSDACGGIRETIDAQAGILK